MISRGIIAPKAKELLKNGEYRSTIIELSASLEDILFLKMFFEYGRDINSMKTWTLGKYVAELERHNSLNKTRMKSLKQFVNLRNVIIHNRNALITIVLNPKSKKKLIDLLRNVYKIAVQLKAV